jgi:hypothetical protein
VRPRDAWVVRPMEQTSARLLSDKPDATAHEEEVIEIITRMKGCALLCWEAVHADGLLNTVEGQVQVHAVSEELRKYVKLELDALRLLPPARRAKTIGGSSSSGNFAGSTARGSMTASSRIAGASIRRSLNVSRPGACATTSASMAARRRIGRRATLSWKASGP